MILTTCHSERSQYCECSIDVVKNPVMDCRNQHTTFIHGILHYAFAAIASKASFRMTYKFVALFLAVIFLTSCGTKEVKPNAALVASSDELPTQTSQHTRMSFSGEGKVRAVLNAIGVRVFEQKRYTLLDSSVHVDFFGSDGNHSSVLTSHRAFINDNTKNMTAYDTVRILSDSGTLVQTDSLLWNNTTHKLHSDAFVRISEKSGRITRGRGFESDQDLVNYKILFPIIDAPTSTFENSNRPAFSSPTQPLGMPELLSPAPEQKDTAR